MAPDTTRSSPKCACFNDNVEEIPDSKTTKNAPDTPFTVAKQHIRTCLLYTSPSPRDPKTS
eukprot:3731123-Ditylum_brightwellii.AAC.1